jgi:hypothetical protein
MRPFSLQRVGALSTLVVLCLAAACPAPAPSENPPTSTTRTGGATGAGGSGGSMVPPAATGGAPGTGGDVGATGGAAGTGGSGAATVDAAAIDVPAGGGNMGAATDADGSAGADGGPIDPNDPKTWPGGAFAKPFIVLCPDGAPKAACCMHYCSCMMTNCSMQIPADCLNACMGNQKWDMRCRVYNCFESLNPLAQKDHQAHCEHAGVVTGTQRTRGAGDTHEKCHNPGDPDEK